MKDVKGDLLRDSHIFWLGGGTVTFNYFMKLGIQKYIQYIQYIQYNTYNTIQYNTIHTIQSTVPEALVFGTEMAIDKLTL